MSAVPFLCGDGSDEITLDVIYVAGFPRGHDGRCAFCHGDPCAESSGPDTKIGAYFKQAEDEGFPAETCPLCEGRPT